MVLLLAIAQAAFGQAPDPAAFRRDLDAWAAAIAADGRYPMAWTEEEKAVLARGDVIKRRERLEGADRALGAVWSPADLRATWVALQDDWHWGHVSGLVEEKLPDSTFENKILFQRLDAPWPFKDRQWTILITNNMPLFHKTERGVIERTWDLSPRRGASVESADGIWVPVNEGGWFAASIAGGSLIVYHVRTVVGGTIPDDAATQWTLMTLSGMLRGLVESSVAAPEHYVGDHPRIRWPDGDEIPPYR